MKKQTPKRHLFPYTPNQQKKEYEQVNKMEKKWVAHLTLHIPLEIRSAKEARLLVKRLCKEFWVSPPKVYHLPRENEKECSYHDRGMIVIATRFFIALDDLLHELAHYIVYKREWSGKGKGSKHHGNDFLFVLHRLYELYKSTYIK